MALSNYAITAGDSFIHRFRLAKNGRGFIDEVFNFSSLSGDTEEKTSKQISLLPSTDNWNAVDNPQNIYLPALSLSNWALLDARNITEINTGKNIVCALLSSSQQNKFSFLIVTTICNKLAPLKYINVDKQSLEVSSFFETCKPQLIDGPGLMWVRNCTLHVATSSYGSACRLALKSYSLAEDSSHDESKQTLISVLFYHHFQGMSLVVGTKINEGKNNNKETFAVVFSIPIDSFKNVDITRILPEPYVSTAQHVKVLQCSYSKKDDKVEQKNYCLNIRLLTVTSEGYLTEFHSGKLIRCLYIPSIRVGISKLTAIPTFDGSTCFPVIITNEHKACIVSPQLKKVHSIMEGFSDALVDDFMGWGSPQLLLVQLLPTSEPNILSNHWLLTDFDSCHFVSEPTISMQEDNDCVVTDECPEAVEKALSNKIQLEILTMEEKSRLLKIRNDFIINCWQQLLSMQSMKGKHCPLSSDRKPGLMPFVEGSAPRVSPVKQTHGSSPLEVIRLWQKIYCNQWIVGVTFRYSRPKFLKRASLLITACNDNDISKPGTIPNHFIMEPCKNSMLCGQSLFWKNTTITSFSPEDHFNVTCVLDTLPELAVDTTRKFLVLLCLYTIHEELQTLQLLTYPCGSINFGVQQMIGANVNGSLLQTGSTEQFNDLEDSVYVLDTVQSHYKVHVRSKKSGLTFLEEHLKSFLELSWNSFLKCFLWHSNSGPFSDTRFTINKVQPHDCLLSIFTREVSCIPAIVHFLYSKLPEDVVILPEMSISMAKVSTWLQQLQFHMQSLSKEFCLLEDQGISSEGRLATDESEQLTADFLDHIRHECVTKKTKMADRHVVNPNKCQTLITFLEKQKLCLDSLAVIFS